MIDATTYLIAADKSWNRDLFDDVICHYPGKWHFIGEHEELTSERLQKLDPQMIFFLHWSWLVPAEIVENYDCVCFHMTDLPYGRGGSPLQNLIVNGHKTTKLTALKMVRELDAGPIYLKANLDLSGSAEEIFIRTSKLAARMIERLITEHPLPQPQTGDVFTFARRKPEQSRIPDDIQLEQIYDHIRMLDAEGYPSAFLDHKGYRYRFSQARLLEGRLVADVVITPVEKESP